jgi:hypothetical protein
MASDLDSVACFGLAFVGLMGDHNIEALNARCELRNLSQLIVQVTAETL